MKNIFLALIGLVTLTVSLHAQEPKPQATPDPQAYELLKRAQSVRESFPSEFAGFQAELVCDDNGKEVTGTLDYQPATGIKVTIAGLSEDAHNWLKQQLNSWISHRRAGDFAKGEGRYPLSLPVDNKSPLGRRVIVNDKYKSSYRLLDGQITEVDRTMGDNIVVTILSTLATGNGRYLPQHFVMSSFDTQSRQLLRSDMYTDEFTQVANVWLPASRRVITAEGGRLTARVIKLRKFELHKAANVASGNE
jgi:Protein of unknown function (DUF3386)